MLNKPFKVLFVCSSNVCRSPYCEYVFRRMIENDDLLKDKVEVNSSAVFNKSKEIFPRAVTSLVNEGFDEEYVLSHKPTFKWGDGERFAEADVIIGMSKTHKLLTPFKYQHKFVTLSEAATGEYSPVPDPFLYATQEKYDECMQVLKAYLQLYFEIVKAEFKQEN